VLAIVAAMTVVVASLSMHIAEQRLRADAQLRTDDRRDAIAARVDRLRHLTTAIAGHPGVGDLLDTYPAGIDADLTQHVNAYLAKLAAASDASLLYVIDKAGITRAASNHAASDSLIGNEYTFRPYFQDAIRGEEARYYAVGATTGVAGYYFARPVKAGTRTLGIAVVKVELESLQDEWAQTEDRLLLIDEHGISIAANPPNWRFRYTRKMSDASTAAFKKQRKYADATLRALDHSLLETANPDTPDLSIIDAQGIDLERNYYLVTVSPLPDQNWHLIKLTPQELVRMVGIQAAMAWLLIAGLSTVALLYRQERKRRGQLILQELEAARMRTLNEQLKAEVAERRKAELELKATQAELIQASKLAALGQMSAAIAHEVNQPLSAIRTFSASARLLIQRDRTEEVVTNLSRIEELTERLATMTSELKVFSRKSHGNHQPVDLARCLQWTLDQFVPSDDTVQITCTVHDQPVIVSGSAVRLEQVIRNLLVNAVEATQDNQDSRVVDVTLHIDHDTLPSEAVLRVADNGTGLDDHALAHLFDPFYTTKPVGQGVGLGLAISYGIVQEMRGQLTVRNRRDCGALFSLRLSCKQGEES
jgi:two-component system C4-dicarboxylate transport sensor histidine kinase DctB